MFRVAEDQKRNAERLVLKEPIKASIGDGEARITEISLIGGRIEHVARLSMNSTVTLHFRFKGQDVKLKAKIARTEMKTIDGKLGYSSGVDFAKSPEEAPPELRRLMAGLVEPEAPVTQPPPLIQPGAPAPFIAYDDEVEEIEAAAEVNEMPYVQCVWEDEAWVTTRTEDPRQPRNGFTMIAPADEGEIVDFCRTYEVADPETQRMIRLSFELAIAQYRRG